MQTIESRALLAELFEEYSEWYYSLAEENGVLPRSVSGVSDEGKQFIYMIDGLDLHHMVRNKYLRYVLDEHHSVAYAYGGLALRGDSEQGEIEEVLDIVAADSKRYILGHWRLIRGEEGKIIGLMHMGTSEGDDPEKQPSAWFLAGAIRFTEPEKLKFGSIWEQAKGDVIFKDRSVADEDD
ncbi:MAG: hypothetical protein HGB22_03595 [Chlorobiaceae bacterium]|nr:hypothetical protein [Chlorobiaceae bacterium]